MAYFDVSKYPFSIVAARMTEQEREFFHSVGDNATSKLLREGAATNPHQGHCNYWRGPVFAPGCSCRYEFRKFKSDNNNKS